jgi:WD40 repeat protein
MAEGAIAWDVFMSYNREADTRLARVLRRGLRRIGIPWYKRSRTRIFLDQTSLAANPDAWRTVEQVLATTRSFVLLASPQAAKSEWVDREVAQWRSRQPARELVVALTEGTLAWNGTTRTLESAALPPSAKAAFTSAPLWVDLTWAQRAPRWRLTLWNPIFRDNVASLAAAVRAIDKEAILDEDGRRRRRGLAAAAAVAAAGVALSVVLVLALQGKSLQERVAASRELAHDSTAALAERPDLALLLGVYANQTSSTVEARAALFDALSESGHLRRFLQSGAEITSVALDASGRTAALGRVDGRVEVWDARAGRRVRLLAPPPGGGVARVAFAESGAVVAGWSNGAVAAWDSESDGWRELARGSAAVETLAASTDGRTIAAGLHSGHVIFVVPAGGPAPRAFRATTAPVRALAFDPAGSKVAVGTQLGELVLRSVRNGRAMVRRRPSPPAAIVSVAFDGHGIRVATGREDGLAFVWNQTADATQSLTVGRRNQAVTGLAFDGMELLTTSTDGRIRSWDLGGAEPAQALGKVHSATGFARAASGAAVTSDGSRAEVWNFHASSPLARPLARVEGVVRALALDPASDTVAVSTQGGLIELVDGATGGVRRRLWGAQRDVVGLAFEAQGSRLVAVRSDGSVVRWQLGTGTASPVLPTGPESLQIAAVAPGGARFAFVDKTGSLHIDRPAAPALAHVPVAASLAVDGQAKRVAAGGLGTISLFDEGGHRQLLGFPKAAGGRAADLVTSLAFSADGRVLAGGNADREAALWDLRGPPRAFASHLVLSEAVTALAFSRDGSQLATGAADGRITLWHADPADWEVVACRVANRDLSRKEREEFIRSAAKSARGCLD